LGRVTAPGYPIAGHGMGFFLKRRIFLNLIVSEEGVEQEETAIPKNGALL
jgi:hypothetical protein